MALAHRDAAGGDQGGGGEAEFVGAEQRADHDIAAGSQPAINLHSDPRTQPVQDQSLLRLGKADFPRNAGVLDRGEQRRPGAPLEAGNSDMIGAALGDARGDGPTPASETSLTETPASIDVLQIEDELGQILDRIDATAREATLRQ